MKKIFLLSGKARAGKDTTAQILKAKLEEKNQKVAILHFAKYIKDYMVDYMNWNGEKTEEWRTKLQILGTETIKEKLNMTHFHVNRIVEDIKIINELGYDYFIIPDARFRSEMHYMMSHFPYNTKSIRVHRLGYKSELTVEQQNHMSEIDLDNYKFDHNIYVQSGVEHLKDEIDRMFDDLL